MDYEFADKRKSRNDKRAKMRFNKYKRGGHQRGTNINLSNKRDNSRD